MPAIVHEIDFSSPKKRSGGSPRLHFAHRRFIPFLPETAILSSHRPLGAIGCFQHEEPFPLLTRHATTCSHHAQQGCEHLHRAGSVSEFLSRAMRHSPDSSMRR